MDRFTYGQHALRQPHGSQQRSFDLDLEYIMAIDYSFLFPPARNRRIGLRRRERVLRPARTVA